MIAAHEAIHQLPRLGRKEQLRAEGWPGMDLPETIFKIVVKKPDGTHHWKGYIQFQFFDNREWWTAVIDHNTRTGMMPSFQRNTLKGLLNFIQNTKNDPLRVKVYEIVEMERV